MTNWTRSVFFVNATLLVIFLHTMFLILPSTAMAEDEAATVEIAEVETGEEQTAGDKEETQEKLVTNMFYDTSLRQALSDVSAQTGVVIVPDMSVQALVTCELNDVPLDKALEILLAGTGYVVKKTPDYYLVCSVDPTSPSFSQVTESRSVKLNYAKADAAVKLLSPAFQNYIQAEVESNIAFVTAPQGLMERIISDLKQIDQPPRQVMLDTRIVVIEKGSLANLGVEWKMPQIQAGAFSNSVTREGLDAGEIEWPWGVEFGYTPGREFTDSLLLTLNLLAQNNHATMVTNPQLMAQDGKEAMIKVSTEEYFQILTEGYYARSQLEKIETGTTLTITPRISDNSNITLNIMTEVSDVVARGENNLPVVTRRQAQGTLRIQDGGTAVIAGLTDDRRQFSKTRVPGFGDIAVLGNLFRSNATSETIRQVAAFVTVRIISEDKASDDKTRVNKSYIKPVGEEFKMEIKEILARDGRKVE